MYICICNGFTDRQIRVAVRQGTAHSVSDVYRCIGCKPQCGRCAPTVLKVMRESSEKRVPNVIAPEHGPADDPNRPGAPKIRFADAAE
jgi:bacterioferritin-associated ferredoxin